jgi:sialate O-acetylesterase
MSAPKTGMVVTMDIGNLTDIHPKNKQEVGRRLALWALAKDYARDAVYSGPIYQESVVRNGNFRLKFEHLGSGLATRDGQPPSHFEVAGPDQVFHPATAVIDGDQLVVSSDKVAKPKAVRYAFSSQAMPNLMNREGLPASPFRTDRW